MSTWRAPRSLTRRSALQFAWALTCDWGLIAASFAIGLAVEHWIAWGLAILLIGSRQHALGILGHEAVHGLAFKNRKLNDWVGRVACLSPLWIDLGEYRRFHVAHHRALGAANDPEHAARFVHGTWPLSRDVRRRLGSWAALFLGGGAPHLLRLMIHLRPRTLMGVAAVAVTWLPVALVIVHYEAWMCLAIWLIANLTVAAAAHRVRELSEHTGLVGTHRVRVSWLLRWLCFPHACEHHFEHHRSAGVPFYRLRDARKLMGGEEPVALGRLFRELAAGSAGSASEPRSTNATTRSAA